MEMNRLKMQKEYELQKVEMKRQKQQRLDARSEEAESVIVQRLIDDLEQKMNAGTINEAQLDELEQLITYQQYLIDNEHRLEIIPEQDSALKVQPADNHLESYSNLDILENQAMDELEQYNEEQWQLQRQLEEQEEMLAQV